MKSQIADALRVVADICDESPGLADFCAVIIIGLSVVANVVTIYGYLTK